jgi:hypothetical protein
MIEDKENEFINVLGTKVRVMSIILLGFFLFVGWLILHWFFGTEIPGHWLEKSSYQTQLFVNVFPDNDKTKNYRLVGNVERYNDCDGDDGCVKGYYVKNISFPNKGYIEFDACEISLNKKQHCIDYDGKEWYVELTDQKP